MNSHEMEDCKVNVILKNKEKIKEAEIELEKLIEKIPGTAVEVCLMVALLSVIPLVIAILMEGNAWIVVLGIDAVIVLVVFAGAALSHKYLKERLKEYRELLSLILSGIRPEGIEPRNKNETIFIFTTDTGEKVLKKYRCFLREYSNEKMDKNDVIIDCGKMTICVSASYILETER